MQGQNPWWNLTRSVRVRLDHRERLYGHDCLSRINNASMPHVYRIRCELGRLTDTGFADGRTLERSYFQHVKQRHLASAMAAVAGAHRREIFRHLGVGPRSQAAYEVRKKSVLCYERVNNAMSFQWTVIYGISLWYEGRLREHTIRMLKSRFTRNSKWVIALQNFLNEKYQIPTM